MASIPGTVKEHAQAIVLSLLLTVFAPAIAEERPAHVAIEIEHPFRATTVEGLRSRLVAALCGGDAAGTIRSSVGDRIRLTVSVRPVSATTLRGFWLPFSGVYGVGTLRLAVERMVTLPGVARAVPAVVWQAERALAGPWRNADQDIARSLDEMAAELHATGPKQECGPLG
ncbi:MAG TPA: hypothetical protein VIE36_07320 [Methylomirabilota bacterium]